MIYIFIFIFDVAKCDQNYVVGGFDQPLDINHELERL
jgi:hypothetical protein